MKVAVHHLAALFRFFICIFHSLSAMNSFYIAEVVTQHCFIVCRFLYNPFFFKAEQIISNYAAACPMDLVHSLYAISKRNPASTNSYFMLFLIARSRKPAVYNQYTKRLLPYWKTQGTTVSNASARSKVFFSRLSVLENRCFGAVSMFMQ